jgi:hypothetical protein
VHHPAHEAQAVGDIASVTPDVVPRSRAVATKEVSYVFWGCKQKRVSSTAAMPPRRS